MVAVLLGKIKAPDKEIYRVVASVKKQPGILIKKIKNKYLILFVFFI